MQQNPQGQTLRPVWRIRTAPASKLSAPTHTSDAPSPQTAPRPPPASLQQTQWVRARTQARCELAWL